MAVWDELAEAAGRVGWRDVADAATETAYVVVGLGILGIQRAQVHRVELQRRVTGEAASAAGCVEAVLRQVRSAVRPG